MDALNSEDEISSLLRNRPEHTRTYQVPEEIFRRVPLDATGLRRMTDEEVRELANYLEVDVGRLAGPFRVAEADCPNCGRRITFLDFVKTAVTQGIHSAVQLREILVGGSSNWITIRGRDGGRLVSCANCGQALRMHDGYSEYSSSAYAYA